MQWLNSIDIITMLTDAILGSIIDARGSWSTCGFFVRLLFWHLPVGLFNTLVYWCSSWHIWHIYSQFGTNTSRQVQMHILNKKSQYLLFQCKHFRYYLIICGNDNNMKKNSSMHIKCYIYLYNENTEFEKNKYTIPHLLIYSF
jgi:hypothetical protein